MAKARFGKNKASKGELTPSEMKVLNDNWSWFFWGDEFISGELKETTILLWEKAGLWRDGKFIGPPELLGWNPGSERVRADLEKRDWKFSPSEGVTPADYEEFHQLQIAWHNGLEMTDNDRKRFKAFCKMFHHEPEHPYGYYAEGNPGWRS